MTAAATLPTTPHAPHSSPKGEVPSPRGGGGELPTAPNNSYAATPPDPAARELSAVLELLLLAAAKARLALIEKLQLLMLTADDPVEQRRAAATLLRATQAPLIPLRRDEHSGLYAPHPSHERGLSSGRSVHPSRTSNETPLDITSAHAAVPSSPPSLPTKDTWTQLLTNPQGCRSTPSRPLPIPHLTPHPTHSPEHIITTLATHLADNNTPEKNSGLATLAAFLHRDATADGQPIPTPASPQIDEDPADLLDELAHTANYAPLSIPITAKHAEAPIIIAQDAHLAVITTRFQSSRDPGYFTTLRFTLERRNFTRCPHCFLITRIDRVKDTS